MLKPSDTKAAAKPTPKAEEDDSSDYEESSDEEPTRPQAVKKPAQAAKKASSSDEESEEDDEEDSSDEDEKPAKTKKKTLRIVLILELIEIKMLQLDGFIYVLAVAYNSSICRILMWKWLMLHQRRKRLKLRLTPQATRSKTLFMGNLSFFIEESDVVNFFKNAGEVVEVRFAGYGHVEFTTPAAAQELSSLMGNPYLTVLLKLTCQRKEVHTLQPTDT